MTANKARSAGFEESNAHKATSLVPHKGFPWDWGLVVLGSFDGGLGLVNVIRLRRHSDQHAGLRLFGNALGSNPTPCAAQKGKPCALQSNCT